MQNVDDDPRVSLSFYAPYSVAREVRRVARDTNRSLSSILEKAAQEWLDRQRYASRRPDGPSSAG
jgi:hypothetical protein